MATVVSQHVRHIGRHLGFFKNFILRKIAANVTEISRKHVFAASNKFSQILHKLKVMTLSN